MANNNVPNLLSYPPTLGKEVAQGQHYMLIDSYESSSAVDREGSGTRMSSIALYIPPGSLTTTIGQNYAGLEGGVKLATLGLREGAGAGSFMLDAFKSAISKPKLVQDFEAAGFGMARNAHMALVYRGPQDFRTHQFQFEFWPKNDTEAGIVHNIVRDFRLGSTPRTGRKSTDSDKLMAPFFHSPRQWEIKFCKGVMSDARSNTGPTGKKGIEVAGAGENPYLFQIQRSVITTMAINHDPDGVVGFHADGHPVHTRLNLTFQELEYVINEVDPVSDAHKANVKAREKQERNRKIQANIKTGTGGPPSQGG